MINNNHRQLTDTLPTHNRHITVCRPTVGRLSVEGSCIIFQQARLKNEEIRAAQEAKKMEAEKKRKEMEEQRQAELKRKLDEELEAKKASAVVGARL